MVTFLPKSLWLQFGRFMNIYFLFIAILQSVSLLSPVHNFLFEINSCFYVDRFRR